jgi:hypothetical protein
MFGSPGAGSDRSGTTRSSGRPPIGPRGIRLHISAAAAVASSAPSAVLEEEEGASVVSAASSASSGGRGWLRQAEGGILPRSLERGRSARTAVPPSSSSAASLDSRDGDGGGEARAWTAASAPVKHETGWGRGGAAADALEEGRAAMARRRAYEEGVRARVRARSRGRGREEAPAPHSGGRGVLAGMAAPARMWAPAPVRPALQAQPAAVPQGLLTAEEAALNASLRAIDARLEAKVRAMEAAVAGRGSRSEGEEEAWRFVPPVPVQPNWPPSTVPAPGSLPSRRNAAVGRHAPTPPLGAPTAEVGRHAPTPPAAAVSAPSSVTSLADAIARTRAIVAHARSPYASYDSAPQAQAVVGRGAPQPQQAPPGHLDDTEARIDHWAEEWGDGPDGDDPYWGAAPEGGGRAPAHAFRSASPLVALGQVDKDKAWGKGGRRGPR